MAEIILHIGMQRTGTTFLQKEIFPNLNLNFLTPSEINTFSYFKNLEKSDIKALRKKIKPYLLPGIKNLISDENIWWHQDFPRKARYKKLKKLKKLFPNAKIIFGVRNKRNLLLSWYKKFIIRGGTLSFTEYQKKKICLKDLNFQNYIENLYNFYKKENIHIYKFETLKWNAKKFVDEITNFIGVKTPSFSNKRYNKGYSLWQLKFSRFLNRIWKTKANPEGFIPLSYKYIPYRFLFQHPYFPDILNGRNPTIEKLGGLIEESFR